MSKKYFGTDGIRGLVGSDVINPEFILKLGWAIGRVLVDEFKDTEVKVLVGKDTRISGYLLESVLEAGLSAAGASAWMLGPMPTPAVAYLTRTFRAQVGIVITASHNSYYDNGIKLFSSDGMKLPDYFEFAVEKKLSEPMKLVEASKLGKAKRIDDAGGRYIEFCKSTLGIKTNLHGIKLVLDCANGATYHVAPEVFRELGAEVIEMGVKPDGFNINDECGSTAPGLLAKKVIEENADVGIAFDGDGDRVIMVDHKGEIVDGDEIIFIIAKNGFARGSLHGGVVGTMMSNLGLEVGLRKLGVDFVRTQVGDRYVIEALRNNDWLLGGEPSGHIMHLGLTTTGDGIVGALQVMNVIKNTGQSLFELKSQMLKYPQVLLNVKCDNPKDIANDPRIAAEITKVAKVLGEHSRVLLRPSGTEKKVRVMVEGMDFDLVSKSAHELVEFVQKLIVS